MTDKNLDGLPPAPVFAHRLETALAVIAHGLRDEEDRATSMMEIAQQALAEYRRPNEARSAALEARQWWCANCQAHRPGREYHGDLLCACGHVIATYTEDPQ